MARQRGLAQRHAVQLYVAAHTHTRREERQKLHVKNSAKTSSFPKFGARFRAHLATAPRRSLLRAGPFTVCFHAVTLSRVAVQFFFSFLIRGFEEAAGCGHVFRTRCQY
jgi:hypothetical protein